MRETDKHKRQEFDQLRWETDGEYRQRQIALHAEWASSNPEKMREYYRAYYQRNREKRIATTVSARQKRKEYYNQKAREYRMAKPIEARRDAALKNRLSSVFKITVADYEALLSKQGGVCAICGREPKGIRLAVDHDHKCCSGKRSCGKCIRGLLCGGCNRRLGGLEGAWIEKALAYLKSYS